MDDEHVIYAIRDFYKIPKEAFQVIRKDGIEGVIAGTDSTLVDGSPDIRLGIVIDADQDLSNQWQRVVGILRTAGYQTTPNNPDANGTIIKEVGKIIFGVWIMPDNVTTRGMLEDFLSFLVPDKASNVIWKKAVQSSQEILTEVEAGKRFPDIHLSQAQIHSYLAWQKNCGKPFGTAITAEYLQASNPQCEIFTNWLKRLFVDVPSQ